MRDVPVSIFYLVGHRVGLTVPAAPVAAAHGDDGHLRNDDRPADCSGHLTENKTDR